MENSKAVERARNDATSNIQHFARVKQLSKATQTFKNLVENFDNDKNCHQVAINIKNFINENFISYQFNIDDMQEIFMTNYNTLRYEMREENGDFWFNHTSDTWFPTCLPFVRNLPVEEVSGEFKGREYKKYYKYCSR